jgi:arylsulfatase A-like enzyme
LPPTAPLERPNIIWIFGDQHRAQAMGAAGDPNARTPNLDRMAGHGVDFCRAVAGYPLCSPFRGSLLTGIYPHKCVPGHDHPLPDGQPTLAAPLGEAGYRTAYYGKWHVDGLRGRKCRGSHRIVPPERRGGFDEWMGYENNNSQWDSWVHGARGGTEVHYRLPGYETDCLTDLLIEYINDRGREKSEGKAAPFFAALSVQPPHDPYVAPERFMRGYSPGALELRANVPPVRSVEERARRELAGYYAQIENLDWNVGRVTEALLGAGLAFDTLVMFFSDHGDLHGSHGQFRKTAPWEESLRIPFVVWGGTPGITTMHGRPRVPINHVDIAPTTLGLAGVDVPEWMDGFDYSGSILRGRERSVAVEPDSAYIQAVVPTRHGDSVDRPWRGVVTRDGWKYVCLERQPWLMFDLNEDPYELANLAHNTRFGAERKRLHGMLARWVADTKDEFALPEL